LQAVQHWQSIDCNECKTQLPDCCVMHHHARPLLQQLHWLPINSRIQWKLHVSVWRVPRYCASLYDGTVQLSYWQSSLLCVPWQLYHSENASTLTDKSLAVSGPKAWNTLPLNIRSICNKEAFCYHLEAYFLTISYNCSLCRLRCTVSQKNNTPNCCP